MKKRKKTDTLTLKIHACRERIKELVKHCRKIKHKTKTSNKRIKQTGTMCGQLWVLQAFIEANE